MNLPSRFSIGDRVQFKLYETDAVGFPAEVVRISFGPRKVLYDLAMVINGEVYEVYPIRGVDSCFVQPCSLNRVTSTLESAA